VKSLPGKKAGRSPRSQIKERRSARKVSVTGNTQEATGVSRRNAPDLSWYADTASPQKRRTLIKNLCERIAREWEPEKIILFGSQAYGQPTSDSDIDLMVVMPYSGSPLYKAGEILRQLQVWMPVDMIVRSTEDIARRVRLGDRFIQEILARGRVMYDAANG
jgi:predicted nucleotidyltransferase